MAALGLYFGFAGMISIIIISFALGAVLSLILILFKVKKINEYVPFGPFIVIGCYIAIFVPLSYVLSIFLKIFSFGK